jgi:hypothetical protein
LRGYNFRQVLVIIVSFHRAEDLIVEVEGTWARLSVFPRFLGVALLAKHLLLCSFRFVVVKH